MWYYTTSIMKMIIMMLNILNTDVGVYGRICNVTSKLVVGKTKGRR